MKSQMHYHDDAQLLSQPNGALPFGCRDHNIMHTYMKHLNDSNAALIGQQYISWIQCICNVSTAHFITCQDDICTMSQWLEFRVTMIP